MRIGFSGVADGPLHVPYALVLGCSDARAPIEQIFDQSPNDLFVIRVAGNVLGTERLGSIDYAVRNLGGSLALLLVLGHRGCGAVTAAVDLYLAPQDYPDLGLTHALRSLVDRILIAVRGASKAIERVCGPSAKDRPGYRDALIETSVYLNAALTAFDVRREVELFAGARRPRSSTASSTSPTRPCTPAPGRANPPGAASGRSSASRATSKSWGTASPGRSRRRPGADGRPVRLAACRPRRPRGG
nr:carbonic anhydrase [Paludisphaera mucosa]